MTRVDASRLPELAEHGQLKTRVLLIVLPLDRGGAGLDVKGAAREVASQENLLARLGRVSPQNLQEVEHGQLNLVQRGDVGGPHVRREAESLRARLASTPAEGPLGGGARPGLLQTLQHGLGGGKAPVGLIAGVKEGFLVVSIPVQFPGPGDPHHLSLGLARIPRDRQHRKRLLQLGTRIKRTPHVTHQDEGSARQLGRQPRLGRDQIPQTPTVEPVLVTLLHAHPQKMTHPLVETSARTGRRHLGQVALVVQVRHGIGA